MEGASAGAHKLQFRAAENIIYGVLSVIQVVIMIPCLRFVGEGYGYLPGEGVLVDGGDRAQVQVEDDGFFFSFT